MSGIVTIGAQVPVSLDLAIDRSADFEKLLLIESLADAPIDLAQPVFAAVLRRQGEVKARFRVRLVSHDRGLVALAIDRASLSLVPPAAYTWQLLQIREASGWLILAQGSATVSGASAIELPIAPALPVTPEPTPTPAPAPAPTPTPAPAPAPTPAPTPNP